MPRKPTAPPSPIRSALLAQIFGAIMAGGLVQLVYPKLWQMPLAAAAVQGICAAFVSHKLEAPPWWRWIHLGFLPLAALVSTLTIAPGWYLAAFAVLLLTFWRTDKSRVPLFLTNATAADAVADLLPTHPCHVVDLGCGTGGLLRRLARARPDCEFVGIEHAPLPWLWARLATLGCGNVQVRYGDLWAQHLALFDVVYAFLSPAPMAGLWQKALAEMRPGALLISNSFDIPGIEPAATVAAADRRETRLLVYRPGDGK